VAKIMFSGPDSYRDNSIGLLLFPIAASPRNCSLVRLVILFSF